VFRTKRRKRGAEGAIRGKLLAAKGFQGFLGRRWPQEKGKVHPGAESGCLDGNHRGKCRMRSPKVEGTKKQSLYGMAIWPLASSG
jgi:hypothetical protein